MASTNASVAKAHFLLTATVICVYLSPRTTSAFSAMRTHVFTSENTLVPLAGLFTDIAL